MSDETWSQANIDAFLAVIDPDDDATGGGAACATAGAMAAGLVGMVARLSIGKEGLEDESFYRKIDEEARALAVALFDGARLDADAFGAVLGAFRLPKCTDEEKAARTQAIQRGMVGAARVPLENAERCVRVQALGRTLRGCSNENAASDLDCALELASASARGCLSNVAINLTSIKDDTIRSGFADRAEGLRTALHAADADPEIPQRQA